MRGPGVVVVAVACAVLTACGSDDEPAQDKDDVADRDSEASAGEGPEGGPDTADDAADEEDEPEEDALTDEEVVERSEAAREITEDFFAAMLAHDGEAACDLMSETAQSFYGIMAVTEDEDAAGDCPLGFEIAAEESIGPPVSGQSNISGGEVDISPDGLTAQVEVTYPGVPDDQPDLPLSWQEDGWKVEPPILGE